MVHNTLFDKIGQTNYPGSVHETKKDDHLTLIFKKRLAVLRQLVSRRDVIY